MKTITAKLTKRLITEIDELINQGWYANRSEAIRDAVRNLIERKKLAMLENAIKEDMEWGLRG